MLTPEPPPRLSPDEMARVAIAADPTSASSAAEFAKLLAMPTTVAVLRPEGFLIFRVAKPEADIHSFAVAPEARNRGIATGMLQDGLSRLRARGVTEVFLEVDTDNRPALKLYHRAGFFVVGLRPDYYRRGDGSRGDAYQMAYYYGEEDLIGAAGRYRLPL